MCEPMNASVHQCMHLRTSLMHAPTYVRGTGVVERDRGARIALVNQHHADQINLDLTPLHWMHTQVSSFRVSLSLKDLWLRAPSPTPRPTDPVPRALRVVATTLSARGTGSVGGKRLSS